MLRRIKRCKHVLYISRKSQEKLQSWTNSWDTSAFLGRFPIHTGPTLPSPHKQFWTRVSSIFSEFQLCIRWGEGELQENFEKDALRGNRETTEKYE